MVNRRLLTAMVCSVVFVGAAFFRSVVTSAPVNAAVTPPALTSTTLASQIYGASRSNLVGLIQPTLKELRSQPPWKFVALSQLPWDCNPRISTALVSNPIPCTYGPVTATRTVALVGASHAGMWLSALTAMAYQDGFRLKAFLYPGCPPVIMDFNSELVRFDGVVTAKSCEDWNANVINQVNNLNPEIVIVGGGIEAARGVAATVNQYTTGMTSFIARLTTPTKILLGSTVYFPSSKETSRCLSSHLSTVTVCNNLYNGFNANDPTTLLLRRDRIVASTTGARLVPLISLTCTPSTKSKPVAICPPVVNHHIVFTDGCHLSDNYVTYVAPVFRSLLLPALNP